jgi:hypothetical protein
LNSQSSNYEILVMTAQASALGIVQQKIVTVAGESYRVRDLRKIDDGAFSVASLAKL